MNEENTACKSIHTMCEYLQYNLQYFYKKREWHQKKYMMKRMQTPSKVEMKEL